MAKPLEIGLIGFGNIGAGVVRTMAANAALISERLPRPLHLARIADKDTQTRRDAPYDPKILGGDANALIDDPAIDAVIELVGGLEPARTFVERALRAGKHVVTANKAMLAEHGPELFALAREKNRALLFEAAVGGGIPIIRALEQGLSANAISSVRGIINGTANYILTQMEERGIAFEAALAEAQAKGYAEPDPTYDIEGFDTAHKIAILASLAFGMEIRFGDVWVEGIKAIQPLDFRLARELGYAIKLLGIARQETPGGPAEVRVHPTLIPVGSMLASVKGAYNGIFVEADPLGPTFYYGQGAGPRATSSAVISDLMALAACEDNFSCWLDGRLRSRAGAKNIRPREDLASHYYLRFTVADKAGAMARLTSTLAENEISIESMIQHKPDGGEGAAPAGGAIVTIVTHRAVEKKVLASLAAVAASAINLAPPFVLRVEE